MSARANLRLVENGEVPADGPQTLAEALRELAQADDIIAGLERDIRSWAARYAELRRDREAEARDHAMWPVAERIFGIWRRVTGRKRAKFSYDRFELIEPFLRDGSVDFEAEQGPPTNDFEECVAAVIGRNFDHFSAQRRNGSTKAFDEFERIFARRGEFEDSRDRRPRDWRARAAAADPGPGGR